MSNIKKISTKGDNSPAIVSGNYINNSTKISIYNSLSFFNLFRKIFQQVISYTRHYIDNAKTDFQSLSDKCFSDEITVGQQITVEGFLSKYILTHRQDFHIPYTNKAGKTKIDEIKKQVKMEINSDLTQFPIQSFPFVFKNNAKQYIYFLYPPEFNSFILDVDPNKKKLLDIKKTVESVLDITTNTQPIVVISPVDLIQKTEKIVRITGILAEFDNETVSLFSSHLSNTQSKILENSFRPYNESIKSLCIDMSNKQRSRFEEIKSINSLKAMIYAETHFENTNLIDKNYIGYMLPKAYPGLHWVSFNSINGKISCGLCDSNVYIVTKNFTEFAFYTNSDIINPTVNKQQLFALKNFIDDFRLNVRRFYKKHKNIEIRNVYDFLFDYSKSHFFHPKGMMSSEESKKFVSTDSELKQTMNWIQG